MKKLFFLPLCIAITVFCTKSFAQSYAVTPTGLKDAGDTAKTFIVLKADGKTAKELYESALKYITKMPHAAVQAKTEADFIRFDVTADGITKVKQIVKIPIDAKYTAELTFKDGKVKFEVTALDMFNANNDKVKLVFAGSNNGQYAIYNKDGELKRDDAKDDIETYFKNISTQLTQALVNAGASKNDF
ncbi:MAG TPA: hypothetical protein VHB48_13840 [Chitinophagaceae bacterium]|jgi:hypothetical protein|nr:hypothetical protein [Chitinophagaceae bacterium]